MDQREADPQSWNLYTYVANYPTIATDPFGLWKQVDCDNGGQCWEAEDGDTWVTLIRDARFGGFLPEQAAYISEYFQDVTEIIPGQTVVDVSGFLAWSNNLDPNERLRIRLSRTQYDFDPGAGGGIRNVIKAVSKGGFLSGLARLLGIGKKAQGTLTGSLNGLTQGERSMVQELLAQGKNVTIVPRATGKTADFIIDGVTTELKTLQGAGANTLKNAIETASQQGQQILSRA